MSFLPIQYITGWEKRRHRWMAAAVAAVVVMIATGHLLGLTTLLVVPPRKREEEELFRIDPGAQFDALEAQIASRLIIIRALLTAQQVVVVSGDETSRFQNNLQLDELLTQMLLKIDALDAGDSEDFRKRRKELYHQVAQVNAEFLSLSLQ